MNDERVAQIGIVRRLLMRPEVGAFLGAFAVYLLFAFASDKFPTVVGAVRFLDPTATLGIMSVAVALLMIGGEFDLSTGVMTGTTGLLFSYLTTADCLSSLDWLGIADADGCTNFGMNVWVAMLIALIFALAIGFLNGYLVVRTALPSFIVTLGTFFILRGVNVGVTRLLTDRVRVPNIDGATGYQTARLILNAELQECIEYVEMFLNREFLFLDSLPDSLQKAMEIRVSLFWMIGLTLLATWILMRTRIGNWIFAIGGDYNAARSIGVPAAKVKIGLFMTTAAAGWLVGMMTALRLRSTLASQGVGQEFIFIIAAVIGGCLLTGGDGSAIGAAIGALVFGMTRTGITFAGWETDWLFAFLGLMLLGSVFVNNFVRAQARKMRVSQTRARKKE